MRWRRAFCRVAAAEDKQHINVGSGSARQDTGAWLGARLIARPHLATNTNRHCKTVLGQPQPVPLSAVTDRVVQQAIAQVLTPIFYPTFSASSFGFRPGRNAHQAIKQVQAYVNDGWRIAVDIDLAKFFDTVNHDVLMNLLGR